MVAAASAAAVVAVAVILAVVVSGGDDPPSERRLGAVTIAVPSGWASTAEPDRVVLAREPGDLHRVSAGTTGPRMVLDLVEAGSDPAAALAAIADVDAVDLVDAPREVRVADVPAISIVVDADDLRRELLYFSVDGDGYALALEVDVARYRETAREFVALLDGVEISKTR